MVRIDVLVREWLEIPPPAMCIQNFQRSVKIEPIVENLKKSRYQNWTS